MYHRTRRSMGDDTSTVYFIILDPSSGLVQGYGSTTADDIQNVIGLNPPNSTHTYDNVIDYTQALQQYQKGAAAGSMAPAPTATPGGFLSKLTSPTGLAVVGGLAVAYLLFKK